MPAQWERDYRSNANFLGWPGNPLSVEAHIAAFDQALRKRSAFQQPDEEQEPVETH